MSYSTEQQALQKQVWDYCISKGIPEKSTAGIMGNISQESTWDINAIENGDGSGGYGLFQETGTRRDQLVAYGADMTHQLDFFWSELSGENLSITGADLQWFNAQGYSYNTFMSGGYTPTEGASAFCWSWERPDASLANEPFRQSEAEFFYTTYSGTSGDTSGQQVENAVQWMIDIANNDTHGYDQDNRWSPDYDCSSFVISGYEQAGILLKTNGATYTGDMKQVSLDTGFHEVSWNNDVNNLVRGDIILNEIHHVCVYIGDGKIVQASANENGTAHGGQTGDQTGQEIWVRDYYVYSDGWDCVLRYHDGASGGGSTTGGEVWAKIITTPYVTNQLTAEQITFLKTLTFDSKVKLIYTFDKRKTNGTNYTGKRLTIDDLSYIIVDVVSNGFIKLTTDTNNKCYKFVNPKLLKGEI